ncbi:MAG: serine/threonine protein kinase, partial [Gemmatimonadetes bacterium]|nr:serine/threonine protein kinase [Gemmatimonadota bacterium]
MEQVDALNTALAGRYRIERTIGEGGMATVYLARDVRHERDVALKVLDPELGASLGAKRFLAEIRTTAQLHHPHILPLYDSGDADGLLYFVMPFVDGESLRDLLDRDDRLDLGEALRLFTEIADAVGHAHARGIIHRDLKPENVLIAGRHAFVADFGIARAVSAAAPERLTRAGMTLGTPAYMSPEQASGSPRLDARSDVYSLGCLLFEMIAGDPPFTGETNQEVIGQRFQLEIGPSVLGRRSGVPARVDAAIRKAMAREPIERFQSAAQFVEALTADARPAPMSPLSPAVSRPAAP